MTVWHVCDDLVAAYAAGTATDLDAWSAEAHLQVCRACRALVARAVDQAPIATVVSASRDRLVASINELPQARSKRRRSPLAGRAQWLIAVLTASAAIVGSGLLLSPGDSGAAARFAVLVPLIPLAGMGLLNGAWVDPAHELVVATPAYGVELLLRRTLLVLAASMPAIGVSSLVLGEVNALVVGLAAIALICSVLAIGARLGIDHAAALVAVAWTVLAIGPVFAQSRPSPLLQPHRAPLWLVVIILAMALVVAWRDSFEWQSTPLARNRHG